MDIIFRFTLPPWPLAKYREEKCKPFQKMPNFEKNNLPVNFDEGRFVIIITRGATYKQNPDLQDILSAVENDGIDTVFGPTKLSTGSENMSEFCPSQ